MAKSKSSTNGGNLHARSTSERRGWIREELLKYGQVRYDQIRRQFPNLSQKTYRKIIKADVVELGRAGFAVTTMQDKDQVGVIVLMSKTHPYTVVHRATLQKESKAAIGNVACGLIWGPIGSPNGGDDDLRKTLIQSDITRQLELITKSRFSAAAQKANEIRLLLESYWNKSHRSISTDAGTTTSNITKLLAKIRIPDPGSILSALDVFTNSSMIVDTLRDPEVSATVVVIGGRLRKTTDACTGELTRQCLERWHLQLDIAVVGTTNINTKTFEFACDSENESVTKNLILSRATLRSVAADSSKFRSNAPTSSFAFSPINGKSVDLVITDDDVQPATVEMLLNRGVAVLTPSGNHVTRGVQR